MQFYGDAERVERVRFASTLLRHLRTNVLPEIAEFGHIAARNIVGDRHPGKLDEAALDGVHQGEIAHRPCKEGAFGVARAAEEERRRREFKYASDTKVALDDFEARDPQTCGFVVRDRLLFVIPLELTFIRLAGLLATLLRWMKEPEFEAAYREARRAAFGQSVARLQQASSAAVSTLLKVMLDPATPPATKVRAVDRVLDHAAKAIEIEDIEARLTDLERTAEATRGQRR